MAIQKRFGVFCPIGFDEASIRMRHVQTKIVEAHLLAGNKAIGLPEIDLLIRTSGEFRISNFLLWQIAYSEIYVTPTLFPDFRRPQIFEAILDYQKRDRRFGGVK